jgi:hypothetical protein
MPTQPSPRRRFQFCLRTLFVAVTIVAVQRAVCLPALKEWQLQREAAQIDERFIRCPQVISGGCLTAEQMAEFDRRFTHRAP